MTLLTHEPYSEPYVLNIGPQHPSTHGVLRLVARIDGERAFDVRPVIGYMHRGYEKLAEVRNYPQITTIVGTLSRPAAMICPGVVLSQDARHTMPSSSAAST